jgi:hypothetical protein
MTGPSQPGSFAPRLLPLVALLACTEAIQGPLASPCSAVDLADVSTISACLYSQSVISQADRDSSYLLFTTAATKADSFQWLGDQVTSTRASGSPGL